MLPSDHLLSKEQICGQKTENIKAEDEERKVMTSGNFESKSELKKQVTSHQRCLISSLSSLATSMFIMMKPFLEH